MILIGNLQFVAYHHSEFLKQDVVVGIYGMSERSSIKGCVPLVLRRFVVGRWIVDCAAESKVVEPV